MISKTQNFLLCLYSSLAIKPIYNSQAGPGTSISKLM